MNANDQDFLYAALRNDFLAFLHRSVLTLNPGSTIPTKLAPRCYRLPT